MKKRDYLSQDKPLIPASESLPELTVKVFVFSIILAAFLAASNAYLALKIGTTISASIPASVLAIGVLRMFKNSNVLESNIIQTAASGGEGVAAAVAFSLPAMILLHVWTYFPYWDVFLITALGGILGVLFSVPLRRVMLNLPTLRFPEGTAIGNVLRASTQRDNQMKLLASGGLVGALISLAQNGLQVIGSQMNLWGKVGTSILGLNLGFSPAPLAAGFIVGFEAGSSILIGFIGGWLIILPWLAMHDGNLHSASSIYSYAMTLWSAKLRYVGVGLMLVGGIWTLFRLIKPVIDSMKVSFGSMSKINKGSSRRLLRTEHDMSFKLVLAGTVVIAVLMFFLMLHFINSEHLLISDSHALAIAVVTIVYLVVLGFLLATICGYFTGLIGSTNNPLSGVLILALLAIGIIFMFMISPAATSQKGRVAGLMILITTVIATIASISNENLQDLKAGHMVGATPWKQQFILIVGVISSALVVGPVLEMLFRAYGIGGVFPRPGMDPSHMLAAPQAGLMAAVAQGLRTHHLPWNMIIIGGCFAVLCIIGDELLKRRNMRIAVLAVGLGVYLPPEITTPVMIGSLINLFVRLGIKKVQANKERKAELEGKQQSAVLLCCGLVAGAAIMGVLLAIPFMIMGSADALSIVPTSFAPFANFLGLLSLIALVAWIYRTSRR